MNQKTIVLFHNPYYADSIIPRLKEIDFYCQYKHMRIGRRNGKTNMLYNWLIKQLNEFYLMHKK